MEFTTQYFPCLRHPSQWFRTIVPQNWTPPSWVRLLQCPKFKILPMSYSFCCISYPSGDPIKGNLRNSGHVMKIQSKPHLWFYDNTVQWYSVKVLSQKSKNAIYVIGTCTVLHKSMVYEFRLAKTFNDWYSQLWLRTSFGMFVSFNPDLLLT